jgi:hypothetical protein
MTHRCVIVFGGRALAALCLLGGAAQAQLLNAPNKAAPAAQSLRAAPGAVAQAAALEPAWPLRFELLHGERRGAAFPVTRSGSVHVEVQSGGAPLILSLTRPDGRSVERQGSGRIVIDHAATDADVARGVYWRISLREAQVGGKGAVAAVASGQIVVQHPPVDAAKARAAQAQVLQQAQQMAPARPAEAASPQQLAQQAQAAHDKSVAEQQLRKLDAMRPTLPVAAHSQLAQRVALRAQGRSLQQADAAAPMRLMAAQGSTAPAQPTKSIGSGPLLPGGVVMPAGGSTGSTTSKGSAATGAGLVGSSGGAATTAPATAPAIAAISTAEGDPGTPVSLAGAEFGSAPGELRFIVGSGRDVAAPLTYWSATQIVAEVPYADGIPVYDGHVYVKRADGAKSALRAFRFIPAYEVATLGTPLIMDSQRGWVSTDTTPNQMPANSFAVGKPNMSTVSVFGDAGYDEFYVHARLKNGWVTEGASVVDASAASVTGQAAANAYVVNVRAGTDSPWVKVRWWVDPLSRLSYGIRVTVKRPKNLPCAANPCAVL